MKKLFHLLLTINFFIVCLLSNSLLAYSIEKDDFILHPVIGSKINVLRTTIPSTIPSPGLIVGADLDYALDKQWSLLGGLKPIFYSDNVEINISFGGKYRHSNLGAPLYPYLSASGVFTALFPTDKDGKVHINTGIRGALGLEYFILRHLAIGFDVGFDLSLQWMSKVSLEFSVAPMFVLSWRL